MYREIDHTADYAIHVTAPDLSTLFIEAALGMISLTGAIVGEYARSAEIELDADDPETLLVTWLEELNYLMESENLVVSGITFKEITTGHLVARCAAHHIVQVDKLIKAVTFHDLKIECGGDGCQTIIVFDV